MFKIRRKCVKQNMSVCIYIYIYIYTLWLQKLLRKVWSTLYFSGETNFSVFHFSKKWKYYNWNFDFEIIKASVLQKIILQIKCSFTWRSHYFERKFSERVPNFWAYLYFLIASNFYSLVKVGCLMWNLVLLDKINWRAYFLQSPCKWRCSFFNNSE